LWGRSYAKIVVTIGGGFGYLGGMLGD
jgi:hypothetical protein